MFVVLVDDYSVGGLVRDDAAYKILDTSDLVVEILSGEQLLNAVHKLGLDKFSNLDYMEGDTNDLWIWLDGENESWSSMDSNLELACKDMSESPLNFKVKFFQDGFYSFYINNLKIELDGSTGLYINNKLCISLRQYSVDEDVYTEFWIRSFYKITEEIYKLTLFFATDLQVECSISVFIDIINRVPVLIRQNNDNIIARNNENFIDCCYHSLFTCNIEHTENSLPFMQKLAKQTILGKGMYII